MTRSGPDRRPSITVKGDQFTPEFRALLNKAAKKAGTTQAQFVADVLGAAARRVLAGGALHGMPEDVARPPAVASPPDPADLARRLADAEARGDDTARAVQDLALSIEALQRQADRVTRRRWPRIRWD